MSFSLVRGSLGDIRVRHTAGPPLAAVLQGGQGAINGLRFSGGRRRRRQVNKATFRSLNPGREEAASVCFRLTP